MFSMDEVATTARTEALLKDEGLSQATTGLWTGVAGMGLAMIGPFTCYMSYLIALPCGLVSVYTSWRAYEALRGLESASAERSMAMVGLVSGAITSAFSGLAVMMFAMIAALYAAIFAFSLVGAATGS
jgi:hypothetical protein